MYGYIIYTVQQLNAYCNHKAGIGTSGGNSIGDHMETVSQGRL